MDRSVIRACQKNRSAIRALSAHYPSSAIFMVTLARDGIDAVSTERCDHETMSHRTGGEATRELHRNEETHERARRASPSRVATWRRLIVFLTLFPLWDAVLRRCLIQRYKGIRHGTERSAFPLAMERSSLDQEMETRSRLRSCSVCWD